LPDPLIGAARMSLGIFNETSGSWPNSILMAALLFL